MTSTTTACKECGCYYSVRIDGGGNVFQWVKTTNSGFWFLMEGETEQNLAIPDYQTNYLCFHCKDDIEQSKNL